MNPVTAFSQIFVELACEFHQDTCISVLWGRHHTTSDAPDNHQEQEMGIVSLLLTSVYTMIFNYYYIINMTQIWMSPGLLSWSAVETVSARLRHDYTCCWCCCCWDCCSCCCLVLVFFDCVLLVFFIYLFISGFIWWLRCFWSCFF